MRIVTVNEFRVEVTLSPEELREFDITYEQLDYADADTRRVLWTLLAEVRRMNGVALDVSGKDRNFVFTVTVRGGQNGRSLRVIRQQRLLPAIVPDGFQ